MASVTKSSEEKREADEEPSASDSKPQPIVRKAESAGTLSYRKPEDKGPGFFTLYKRGQGYWTRMGTLIGALLIAGFTAYTLYVQIPTFLSATAPQRAIAGVVTGVFLLGYALLGWRLMNKPSYVEFLISTDSEMKKVNWTSRRELVGSTQIVIIFMFLIAIFLFVVDQIFWELMYLIHVLKISPW